MCSSFVGVLTLDAQSDAGAQWFFQMSATLTTAPNSLVLLVNGAQAGNVYWSAVSSISLGSNSLIVGDLLAAKSITLGTDVSVSGYV
jgi:hypothetical protein